MSSEEILEEYSVKIVRDESTNQVMREMWYDKATGVLHRTNGPAHTQFHTIEGRLYRSEEYILNGVRERLNDLPSLVTSDVQTGKVTACGWSMNGTTSRYGGKPAVLKIDPVTEVVVQEEYWEDDQRHRNSGPALIYRDRLSGERLFEANYVRGTRTSERRPSGPKPA